MADDDWISQLGTAPKQPATGAGIHVKLKGDDDWITGLKPKSDLPPLLQNITQSPSQMPKTEGTAANAMPERGIMARVGEGAAAMAGPVPATRENQPNRFIGAAENALAAPGRAAGAAVGGLAGLGAGILEKFGLKPEYADRAQREAGAAIQAGLIAAGTEGYTTPKNIPFASQQVRVPPSPPGPGLVNRIRGEVPPAPAAPPKPAAPPQMMPPARPEMPPKPAEPAPIPAPVAPRFGEPTTMRQAAEGLQPAAQVARGVKQAEVKSKYGVLDEPGELESKGIAGTLRDQVEKGGVQLDAARTPNAIGALKVLDTLPGFEGEETTGITLRNIEHGNQLINKYYGAALRGSKTTGNYSDFHAMETIKQAYDKHIEEAVNEELWSGDPKAIQKLKDARIASSTYKKVFDNQTMKKIADPTTTPEDIVKMIRGTGKLGEDGNAARVWERLEHALGNENGGTLQKVRLGYWDTVKNSPTEIDTLLNSTIGKKMFSGPTQVAMRLHAEALRGHGEATARAAQQYEVELRAHKDAAAQVVQQHKRAMDQYKTDKAKASDEYKARMHEYKLAKEAHKEAMDAYNNRARTMREKIADMLEGKVKDTITGHIVGQLAGRTFQAALPLPGMHALGKQVGKSLAKNYTARAANPDTDAYRRYGGTQ